MKYCKTCKTRAADADSACPKGHPLTVVGEKPATPPSDARPPSPPTMPATPKAAPPNPAPARAGSSVFALLRQVQELEAAKRKIARRGRRFALLALASALAIAGVVYGEYSRAVLDFASLENVRIEQDPDSDRLIHVRFDVKSPGKVAFGRRSGSRHTEKLDTIENAGDDALHWAWPSDPGTGVDFRVVYRSGWRGARVDRHFPVRPIGDEVGAPHVDLGIRPLAARWRDFR